MRSLLYALTVLSLPMRGAWIEIMYYADTDKNGQSLPMRGAWIEIRLLPYLCFPASSLPMRGAWIEIPIPRAEVQDFSVAPHAGSVD